MSSPFLAHVSLNMKRWVLTSLATILVTGANGFIGSHLVNKLKKENKVISLVFDAVMGDW